MMNKFEIKVYILNLIKEINPLLVLYLEKSLEVEDYNKIRINLKEDFLILFKEDINEIIKELEARDFEVEINIE